MAKSADAADLKSAARKGVGVQVPLRAPNKIKDLLKISLPNLSPQLDVGDT
jgi:hypothetical protein